MPRPTRAEVEAALQNLPPEQHKGFLAEVARRLGEPEAAAEEFSPYYAGGKKPVPRGEAIPGYPYSPDNPISDKIASAMGTGIMALEGGGLVYGALQGALKGGVAAAGPALLALGKRAVVGGAAGAGVGSLPVVGMGPKEGATLGVMMALGQKGAGPLWRHGKRKALIEWVSKKLSGGASKADDVLLAEASVPAGISSTATRAIPRAVELPAGTITAGSGAAPDTLGGLLEKRMSSSAATAVPRAIEIPVDAVTKGSATVGGLLKGTPGRSQQAARLLKLRLEARKLTIRERALEVAAERNRIKVLQIESKAGRAGTAKVLPDGQRAMGTSRGGTAKPGPAPTPPDQLEATLRASVEAGKTPKPFDASMSSAQRAPVSPAAANQLETAMVKGEGPGSIPYALGKRSHGPGDIPQMSELMQNVDDIAHNSDVPVAMSKRLLSWLQKASTPAGKVTTRETGLARATVPRRKLLEEYIDIMKDPQWETVFGSDELLRHGTKLEIKLDALRTIEKAMAR